MYRELDYSPKPDRPEPDWSALAQAHDRTVWLHLLALRVPPELARDLKQEVWAILMRKWRDGELEYLQMPGLALRQAEFLARRIPRQQRDVLADNVIDLADQRNRARDAEALLVDRAKLERTLAIVAASSLTCRNVFRLMYCGDGLTTKQVAGSLGLSEQRVRQTLCELRERLRRLT